MTNHFLRYLRAIGLFLLMFAMPLGIAANDNANASESVVRLIGHVPKAIEHAALLKSLNSMENVNVTFVLPLRNQDKLEALIQRFNDPNDSKYGKYLTPEEFTKKFAPSEEDYDKVMAYALSQGLTITQKHANRFLLNVSSTAEAIEKAFKLNLFVYKGLNGRKFYAPDDNPEVPLHIAEIIHGIVGLDNAAVWVPLYQMQKQENANLEANAYPSGPGGGFAPNDLITAYNLSSVSANGTGQAIALFELAGYHVSDINVYTDYFGLPRGNLTNVIVDGGSSDNNNGEVVLDIELALALAPQSHIYVYEGPNTDQGVLDTYNRIATDNIAKQVSTSWGLGENWASQQFLQAENAIFMQMASQGQSMYAAAGDSGAYDDYPYNNNLVVDDPASQPYVTGVGGTKLVVNSLNGAYVSESVWNDGPGDAGGGGVSNVWSIPSWQQNIPNVYSTTKRNVPDVALNSDPNTGYSIYYNGSWQIFGGTSCAAPLWAAFNARVNQQLVSSQKPVLGFVNPVLYQLGKSGTYTADFHDVLVGNNLFYQAHTGYDNATGWGSFNGANLFAALTQSSPPPPQQAPLLNITMTHTGSFSRGRTGQYFINVTNNGNGSTSGTVSVKLNLPRGLTYKSFTGTGWNFNSSTLTFSRSNTLNAGAQYPTITVAVNVAFTASALVIPSATVSGGGSPSSTVSDPTTTR